MRLPDWLIYTVIAAMILVAALLRDEGADAPPAPEPLDEAEGALLGPITPFDEAVTVNAPDTPYQPSSGTAFAIAAAGRWVTARHVVEGCRQPALVVGGGRALAADVRLAPRADVALLVTSGGPPALPVAMDADLRKGMRAFHPGFPQGRPGEVTSRLLARETLRIRGRGKRDEPVLAWAESGRTADLEGRGLAGLSGAPALDRRGRVLGVTIAEAPRRGRVYTTAPETFLPTVRGLQPPEEPLTTQALTVDNYGLAADSLRRELKVARVVCLAV